MADNVTETLNKPYTTAKPPLVLPMDSWQAKLVLAAELARRERVRGLTILFDGPAMNISRLQPCGRHELG